MANIRSVVEGLTIIARTGEIPRGLAEQGETDGMTGYISAEHDIIYAPPCEPTEEEIIRLKELGWFWCDEVDSWAIFT